MQPDPIPDEPSPGARPPRAPLEETRDELRARLADVERRLEAAEATWWWQIRAVLKDGLRHPARLPRILGGLLRAILGVVRPSADLRRAARLFDEKRYDEAAERCDRVLARDPANIRALRGKRVALGKMGDVTGMLATVRQMRAVIDGDALARAERALEGRLRELDPTWLPDLPGAAGHIEPIPGRVLHILKHSQPYQTNGYTVRSRYTLLAQRRAGLEPVVVTTPGFPRSEGVGTFPVVENLDGIPHHRLDLGPDYPYDRLPPDEQVRVFAWLAARVLREVRPAVVHARSGFRGYETAIAGLALAEAYDLPLVYEVSSFLESTWTADVAWSERGELYRLRSAQEDRCMRAAARVVTIAEAMRADIVARGIDPVRVVVIPNAVDAEAFRPEEPDPAFRRELGLGDDVILGYVSNLGAREGIDVLIEATALLARRGLPVACVVAGDGPERPSLEALARRLGIADRVKLLGAVPHEDIRRVYASIDVFVVPRRDDRAARLVTPLKPYEAMAMSRPLLVSALPALVEVVGDGERGLTFTPEDPAALAAAAEPLIRDPALRRRMGEDARAWVAAERTWDANGRRYRALYEEVIAERASRRRARPPVARAQVESREPAAGDPVEREIAELRDRIAEREDLLRRVREGRWWRVGVSVRRDARRPWRLPALALRGMRALVRARGTGDAGGVAPPANPATHSSLAGPAAEARVPGVRPGSLLERGTDALAMLGSTSPDGRRAVLGYWPVVQNNPYQALLYGSGWQHGIAPVPVVELDAFDDAPALVRLGADVWLHVHWTAPVLQRAGSRRDAQRMLDAFVARLDALKAAGGSIAWTIHNILPHERRFEDLEIAVCRALADRADLIHVLCDRTPELTAPVYTLPAGRVRVIPHPSYLGAYPDHLTRAQARFQLGLAEEHTVLGVLGGIRRYKGIGALLDAFDAVEDRCPEHRLVIAGRPINFPGVQALRGRCERDPRVVARFERIPEHDLQLYLRAADAIVLPYEDILNSGILMLAFTFGVPVIAPDRGCVGGFVAEDAGIRFDPAAPDGLTRALLRAGELKDPRFAAGARRAAEAYAPDVVGARFASALWEAAGGAPQTS